MTTMVEYMLMKKRWSDRKLVCWRECSFIFFMTLFTYYDIRESGLNLIRGSRCKGQAQLKKGSFCQGKWGH